MTDLYQKILLVQNIPKIQGISEAQDLIKLFAYRGDMFMEKANMFEKRFCKVLQHIKKICINIRLYIDNDNHLWSFYAKKQINNQIIFQSRFCGICGDYKTTFYRSRNITQVKYPKCKCIIVL